MRRNKRCGAARSKVGQIFLILLLNNKYISTSLVINSTAPAQHGLVRYRHKNIVYSYKHGLYRPTYILIQIRLLLIFANTENPFSFRFFFWAHFLFKNDIIDSSQVNSKDDDDNDDDDD